MGSRGNSWATQDEKFRNYFEILLAKFGFVWHYTVLRVKGL